MIEGRPNTYKRKVSSPRGKFGSVFKYTLITLAIIGLFLYGLAYPKSELFGKVIFRLNYPGKVVALTFDDGPNGEYTEQVLDILEGEDVKGTFFLIGKNVETYPEIAKEIVAEGHCIGNHSYTHPWLLPFETKKGIAAEISKTERAIYNATGVHPRLFRPPHGFRTPWMISALHKMGYKVIMWDDMTTDYMAGSKPKGIAHHIISHCKPGSIIVLHDGLNLDHGANRENTIEALRVIIKELKNEGYRFVTLKTLE